MNIVYMGCDLGTKARTVVVMYRRLNDTTLEVLGEFETTLSSESAQKIADSFKAKVMYMSGGTIPNFSKIRGINPDQIIVDDFLNTKETQPLAWDDDIFKPDFIMKPAPVSKDDHKSWWMERGLCPVCKSSFEKPASQPGGFFVCGRCNWNNMQPKKD